MGFGQNPRRGTDRGGNTAVAVPPHSIEDGINAVRHTLPHCWFAEDECSAGIRHLKHYSKDWDGDRGVWKDKPRHDSSSRAADAFATSRWRGAKYHLIPSQHQRRRKSSGDDASHARSADMWREYADERRERDEELPEDFEEFNLNNTTVEMK